ncbi:MAG: hypothetical protein COA58_09490 [Bacteroidetes bacterium]|nr:MAG: hypothetical protein COA58_09490 [Bacteroidota bacterium]
MINTWQFNAFDKIFKILFYYACFWIIGISGYIIVLRRLLFNSILTLHDLAEFFATMVLALLPIFLFFAIPPLISLIRKKEVKEITVNPELKTIKVTKSKANTSEYELSHSNYNVYPMYIFNVYTLDKVAIGRSGNPYYPNYATIVCVIGTGNDKRLKEMFILLDSLNVAYGLNPRKQNFWDVLLLK